MTTGGDGEALQKYRMLAEIGRGGMADVYLAVVQGTAGFNKLVVIKKTRPELADEPVFLAMFLDEARLAARLNHPNVVQTHEVGQEGNRYFIAMEYLDGQPMNRIRTRMTSTFTTSMQVRVLCDVLAGLHHAHELADFDGTPLGVVHRDATPQNVFVTYDGVVKVVDFGIAKAVDSQNETQAGAVKGKVPYMSPEQARGQKVDRRTDLFAVGVMLWEGITGRRMWKGVTELDVMHAIVTGALPSLREVAPRAPEELVQICERALANDRGQRFATAAEMQDALEGWLATTPDRPSARDVGRHVALQFAAERAKVKALIESQLSDVRWSGVNPRVTGLDLPKINPDQRQFTPSAGSPITGGPVTASGSTQVAQVADVRPPANAASGDRNRRLVAIGVGVCAAIAVCALGLRFLAPGPQVAAATPSTAAAPAGPASAATVAATIAAPDAVAPAATVAAPSPGQDAVKVTIHVSPANAKIFLDDALLSPGAYEGKMVKSDKPRRVRAEAAGYASKEESVTLTGDVMLSFALEKKAPDGSPAPVAARGGRPTPSTAEPVAAAPPPTDAPTAAPLPNGKKPSRTIDTANPFQ